MKVLLKTISFVGLALTIVPAFLVFQGIISFELNQNLMLIGTAGWFLSAPYWMNKGSEAKSGD